MRFEQQSLMSGRLSGAIVYNALYNLHSLQCTFHQELILGTTFCQLSLRNVI
jgi:hypothetical protein